MLLLMAVGGLQSQEGAPRISGFMKFLGETRTLSKPSEVRWASLFMGGFFAGIYVAPRTQLRISPRLFAPQPIKTADAARSALPISSVDKEIAGRRPALHGKAEPLRNHSNSKMEMQ